MLKTTAMVVLNQIYATQNWCVLALHDMIYLKPDWAMELAKNNKPSVHAIISSSVALYPHNNQRKRRPTQGR